MSANIATKSVRIRVTNDNNIVTWYHSHDAGKRQNGLRMEVSSLHHNVFGGFLSLKIAVYSAGQGSIRLRDFSYRAIPGTA